MSDVPYGLNIQGEIGLVACYWANRLHLAANWCKLAVWL